MYVVCYGLGLIVCRNVWMCDVFVLIFMLMGWSRV